MPIELKSRSEIERIKDSGRIVREVLKAVEKEANIGISTYDLNEVAEDALTHWKGAIAAFKGYEGFPAALCTSVNSEVVHGIPSRAKILKEGDIVSVDFGVKYNGYYGDSAITIPIGTISKKTTELIQITKHALKLGIEKCFPGNTLSNLSKNIQNYVEGMGYSVVKKFVGHGIGRHLHEEPSVPNFWESRRKGIKFREGLVIAIEPMVNIGTYEVKVLNDNWTVVTKDGSLSAHFEHTVAILKEGPLILT